MTFHRYLPCLLLGIPFTLLGAANLILASSQFGMSDGDESEQVVKRAERLTTADLGELPAGWTISPMEKLEFQDGRIRSVNFKLQRIGSTLTATFSCDFPFHEAWHELTSCYEGTGWDCSNQQEVISHHDDSWRMVRTRLAKPSGENAMLLFSRFDSEGNTIAPPANWLLNGLWKRLHTKERFATGTYFQVQLFCPGVAVGASPNENDLIEIYDLLRERLRRAVTAN